MRPQKFRLFIPRCAKFAHRVEAWQIFGVPHRLIDPLYQSPPNRDISHDQSPGNFRCLRSSFFFSFFFFSPLLSSLSFLSTLPAYLPTYLSIYPPTPYPYHPTVTPLSNWSTKRGRYRESVSSEDRPEEEELNRVRVHAWSCECTPFQPLMPMTCSLIGTKS